MINNKLADSLLGLPEFESADDIISRSQVPFLIESVSGLTDDAFIPMPSEWASKNRYLPSIVTENYGQWDANAVRHIADILDLVHPDNPATHISVIKSVQSGLTVSLGENAMGFFTAYRLGSVAFFTSTKNVGKARSETALDVMIDNTGLDKLIKPMSNRTNRKSADTAFAKEFSGGIRWQLSSYNSIADMKSNTFNLLICDEWDEAAAELKGQGDIAGIIEGRTMGVRMFKILYISTSSSMQTSRIYKNFIEGDQNKLFIPCPHCGEMQFLKLKFKSDAYGLTFKMKKDTLTGARVLDTSSVRYICKECGNPFYESHRNEAIRNGEAEWRPTWQSTPYVPKSPKHRSFAISGLISTFLPWSRICQQFINTNFGEDLLKFKDFTINYLGEPWARVEQSGSWEDIKRRADPYIMGQEVPEGALLFYGGGDIQKDRIEIGVIGVGEGMEKWFVDYQIFFGDPSDLNDKCWAALHQYAYGKKFKVEGCSVGISLIALDSGYDPKEAREKDWQAKSHTVYSFVSSRIDKFIAIKGTGESRHSHDLIQERRISHGVLTKRYDIATPIIKEMLMMMAGETEGPNSIHFPKYRIYNGVKTETSDEFYQQFFSERFQELGAGKMGWKKIRDRNEVWDVAVYGIAAMYFHNLQVWTSDAWDILKNELRVSANKK